MILDFTGDHDYDYIYDIYHITGGILHFTRSQYEASMSVYKLIIDRQREKGQRSPSRQQQTGVRRNSFLTTNISIYGSSGNKYTSPPAYLFASADFSCSILTVAVNNISVCALYLKNVNLAISNLESIIQENPYEYMTSNIVFNLCTLYDLTSSPSLSAVKKTVLHKVRYVPIYVYVYTCTNI